MRELKWMNNQPISSKTEGFPHLLPHRLQCAAGSRVLSHEKMKQKGP